MKIRNSSLLCLALVAVLVVPIFAASAGEGGGATLPAPAGTDLWNYLTKVNYRESFSLWPGKGKLYTGTEPHGMLLTTYVNKTALGAIQGKKGTMPAGVIVVKENYKPDKKLAAITVMYKVAGFNPEAGNWFWVKYAPDGTIQKEGKVGGCIGCHGKAKGNDFLFTGKLK
jgi:hypothetical protein